MGEGLRRIGRGVVAIAPHRGDHRVALRAAFCVAVPLLVLWALGRLDVSIYATFGTFAALYGRFDAYGDRLRMQLAAAATMIGAMLVGTATVVLGAPPAVKVLAVAAVAAAVTLVAHAFRWHPPGGLFATFAAGATASLPATPWSFLDVVVVGGAAAAFCLAVTLAIALLRGGVPVAPVRPPARPADREALAMALTVGVGALLAGLAGVLLIGTHWYWAMVAAVAALGGAHVTARVVRGLQRLAGTVGGILIAAAVLALHLPPLASIAVAVVCQGFAELFVNRNYGIAMLFVTPLALLMVELAAPSDPAELLTDRLLDTVLGVAIGTAVAVVSATIRRRRRPLA